jgi:predicted DNA-binding protein
MNNFENKLVELAKKSRTYPVSIRLAEEQIAYLDELAHKTGLSTSKIIQAMIDEERSK